MDRRVAGLCSAVRIVGTAQPARGNRRKPQLRGKILYPYRSVGEVTVHVGRSGHRIAGQVEDVTCVGKAVTERIDGVD